MTVKYVSMCQYWKHNHFKPSSRFGLQGQEINPKYEVSQGDRLHFVKFETKYIETCLDFLQQNLVASADVMKEKKIKVTGGGAYKYADLLQEKLGLT